MSNLENHPDHQPHAVTEMGQRVSRWDMHPIQMINGNDKKFVRVQRIEDDVVLDYIPKVGWIESVDVSLNPYEEVTPEENQEPVSTDEGSEFFR